MGSGLAKKCLLVTATLMQISPAVLAYDGPRVDYNFSMQEPRDYTICDRYENDTGRHMSACVKGRDEARRMAIRFAGGEGRLEGYLRGYAWGLHKSTKAYMSNAQEMEEGARLVDTLNDHLQTGVTAGIRAGQKDGAPQGSQDARGRFYRAVNTNRLPDNQFQVPATNYQGEDNAYAKYVGKVPTVEEILKEDSNLGDLPIYNSYDRTYLGEPSRRAPHFFWFDNGTYRFETQTWDRPGEAWKIWLRVPGDAKPDYQSINDGAPRTPVVVDPVTGQRSGGDLITDFQSIWADSFVQSYGYYANYYFSKLFHENIDLGQVAGEGLGVQIGKRIARTQGLANAFDKKFKESSKSSYRNSFVQAYSNSFLSTYDDYLKNAKLSIEFLDIIGSDNDGIIQPGESFSVKFKVTNAGGVGTGLNIGVSGDVQNAQQLQNSVNAITSREITTQVIANIDERLRARDRATITLNVNGLSDTLGQQVNQLVELTSKNLSLSTLLGSGKITVRATNVSTVSTPGVVSADLILDGRRYEAIGGVLAPSTSQDLILPFSGIDPLNLIRSSLNAEVVLKHNGKVLEQSRVTLRSEKPTEDLVEYFDQVANSKGVVPGSTTEDERAEAVKKLLSSDNSSEVDKNSSRGGRNMYRKDPQSTIVGKIAASFERGEQSSLAKDRYDSMAKVMIKERSKFKSFLGIAPKRKHYTNLVRKFAKNKKLK